MRRPLGGVGVLASAGGAALLGFGVAATAPHQRFVVLLGGVLLVATAGLAYALQRSKKRQRLLPRPDVLQVAWAAFFLSGLVFRYRGLSDIQQDALDPAAMLRVALVAAVALALAGRVLLSRRGKSAAKRRPSRVLVLAAAFSLYMAMSSLWSVQAAWTLYKSLEYLVGVSLAFVMLSTIDDESGLESLLRLTVWLYGLELLSVWLGVAFAPSAAMVASRGIVPFQIRGVFPSVASNGVGELGAILGIAAVADLMRRDRARSTTSFVLLGGALLTMFLAQGRSAWLGFAAGSILVIGLSRGAALLALLGTSGALVAGSEIADAVRAYLVRGQSTDLLMSLSGRTTYWEYAWTLMQQNPLFGLGAYAAGRFAVLATADATSSVHSAFVEVAVGTGLVGVAMFVGLVLLSWERVARAVVLAAGRPAMRHAAIFAAGLLAMETVRSFFTSGSFIWHPAMKFLFIAVCAEWIVAAQSERQADAKRAGADGEPSALGQGVHAREVQA